MAGNLRRLAAAMLGAAWLLAGCVPHEPGRPFDPVAWRARGDGDGVRVQMIDDLLRRHQLKGRTRAEIIELLGEPTETDKFNTWDMVYWLGPERTGGSVWLSMDSEWLVLDLGADGRVKDYAVVRD
jgi:outer membrane protein assembly factor BamE (lipoprotein component of BamABCDE complex)